MEAKTVAQSRAIWFNIAVAMFAILADNTGLLRGVLSDSGYLALMMLVAAINAYLRTITTTSVRLK